jgi:hypothetical protein
MALRERYDQALLALERLDSVSLLVPEKRNRLDGYRSYLRMLYEETAAPSRRA